MGAPEHRPDQPAHHPGHPGVGAERADDRRQPRRDKARAYASEWQIPRVHGSYEALLDDPDIDVIYIGLPNSLHVEWTVRALEAGKHVLCEKPLALDGRTTSIAIAAAAARPARAATEGVHVPAPSADARGRKRSSRADGSGPIRGFKGAFTFPLTREDDVRLDPALGGGSLWDVGCYPVSYACLLAGAAPVEVFGWQQLSPSGIDLEFAGMMRFARRQRRAVRLRASPVPSAPRWK